MSEEVGDVGDTETVTVIRPPLGSPASEPTKEQILRQEDEKRAENELAAGRKPEIVDEYKYKRQFAWKQTTSGSAVEIERNREANLAMDELLQQALGQEDPARRPIFENRAIFVITRGIPIGTFHK